MVPDNNTWPFLYMVQTFLPRQNGAWQLHMAIFLHGTNKIGAAHISILFWCVYIFL